MNLGNRESELFAYSVSLKYLYTVMLREFISFIFISTSQYLCT